MEWSRRTFMLNAGRALTLGAGALMLGAVPGSVRGQGHVPLCKSAAAKGLLYGAAAQYGGLSKDPAFAELIVGECAIMAPENELKWAALRPTPDSYDFTRADWMAGFAKMHDMRLCGHVLVWHDALPKWFNEVVTPENAEKMMRGHIETVVGHYAGMMHSWDVVNEAVAVWDRSPDGLRSSSPWYKMLGPDYIEIAFNAAAEADPKAMLVLNQNRLEYDEKGNEDTRNATLKLLERMKDNEVPVHALGIQAHLSGEAENFNPKKFRRFLGDVASLDLKILITEMDVDDQKLPADIAARDRIVAKRYAEFLSAALAEPAVIAVMQWGLSDRYTWLSYFRPRADKLPVRTLPFDKDLRPTPAWYAISKAFDDAPAR